MNNWKFAAELDAFQTSPFTIRILGGSTFIPAYDSNGNVMGYYDTDTETAVAKYEYGPFGEPLRATGSKADDFKFRFSTKYEDTKTGLLYYGFRYYDPLTGRWISRDPIGEAGGSNLHGMVENNLINDWDYLGLCDDSRFDLDVALKKLIVIAWAAEGYSGIGNFPEEDTIHWGINPKLIFGYAYGKSNIAVAFRVTCKCCQGCENVEGKTVPKIVEKQISMSAEFEDIPFRVKVKLSPLSIVRYGGAKKVKKALKRASFIESLISNREVAETIAKDYEEILVAGLISNAAVIAECVTVCLE